MKFGPAHTTPWPTSVVCLEESFYQPGAATSTTDPVSMRRATHHNADVKLYHVKVHVGRK